MPKSDSAVTLLAWIAWLTTDGFVVTRGAEDIQTDMATSAVTANAILGDGIQSQKPRRGGSAAIRARNDASNAGDGEIAGRSSSALQSARNSSARKRQEAQPDRCSSTAWRSAGRARPSRYSTNLLSNAAHCFPLRSVPNIWSSLPSAHILTPSPNYRPAAPARRATFH